METSNPIDYFSLAHPLRSVASKASHRARRRMYANFVQEIRPNEDWLVVDVGVTPDRTLPESNFFEALYPNKDRLTATSIEDASFLEEEYPGLRFVRTSGDRLPFEDYAFDVTVSFAVLEHVGTRESQRKFIAELLRISKKLYMTTPNRGFPLELHTFLPFIHWLPQPLHQRILRLLGMQFWASTDNLNLLSKRDLLQLFPPKIKPRVLSHRTLGLESNLIAIVD